jgi:hypothetical protein
MGVTVLFWLSTAGINADKTWRHYNQITMAQLNAVKSVRLLARNSIFVWGEDSVV